MPGPLRRKLERHNAAWREVLTEAREAAGLTQRELAERLGVEKKSTWRTEQGERRLDVSELFLWAEALGTTPETLLRRVRRKLAR